MSKSKQRGLEQLAGVCRSFSLTVFPALSYQINARTELAVRYNDISPLENHHCAVAFQIISQPEFNIFSNVDQDQFKQIRQVGMLLLVHAVPEDINTHGLPCSTTRVIHSPWRVGLKKPLTLEGSERDSWKISTAALPGMRC